MESTGEANRRRWNVDFLNFPPGYRFKPSDEELVTQYLVPTLEDRDVPPNIIRHIELYDYNPYMLKEVVEGDARNNCDEWYFFTRRKRKYKNGKRPDRMCPGGYWKATGKEKPIKDGRETVVGDKRSLVFYKGKPPGGVKTDYIMHEFTATNRCTRQRLDAEDMLLDGHVLCRIYNKSANTGAIDEAKNEDNQRAEETNGEIEQDNDRSTEGNNSLHEESRGNTLGEITIPQDFVASILAHPYPTDEILMGVNYDNAAWNVSAASGTTVSHSQGSLAMAAPLSYLNYQYRTMPTNEFPIEVNNDYYSNWDDTVISQDSLAVGVNGITTHQDSLAGSVPWPQHLHYRTMDSNAYGIETYQDSLAVAGSNNALRFFGQGCSMAPASAVPNNVLQRLPNRDT